MMKTWTTLACAFLLMALAACMGPRIVDDKPVIDEEGFPELDTYMTPSGAKDASRKAFRIVSEGRFGQKRRTRAEKAVDWVSVCGIALGGALIAAGILMFSFWEKLKGVMTALTGAAMIAVFLSIGRLSQYILWIAIPGTVLILIGIAWSMRGTIKALIYGTEAQKELCKKERPDQWKSVVRTAQGTFQKKISKIHDEVTGGK